MLSFAKVATKRAGRGRSKPACEPLEDRRLMAADPGYILSGNQWANPGHITFSFPPDGVQWDQATNNLNATFNARFGGTAWQDQVAKALQTWASVANLDFVRTDDTALPFDVPGKPQGDPRFGDIRIGGFNFNDATTLAQTYSAPPNGLTAAGDSEINTAQSWNIGSVWDLYSVELHEMGLALGLAETPDAGLVMNANYHGTLAGLTPQDTAGIQAIYGARAPDAYQAHGAGTSAATAVDLTARLDPSGRATVGAVSLATIGDTEYFRVVAPAGATALQVTAGAKNLSLLSPEVRILDAAHEPLASGGDASTYGDDASAGLSRVVPGQVYEIAVTGATQDVFAVGAYRLNVAFTVPTPPPTQAPPAHFTPTPTPTPTPAPTPSPTPTAKPTPSPTQAPSHPPIQSPNPRQAPTPSPTSAPRPQRPTIHPDRFQPNTTPAKATYLGVILQETVGNLSIASPRTVHFFKFRSARAGYYRITAPGVELRLYDSAGHLLGRAEGNLLFHAPTARTPYLIETSSRGGKAVAHYSLKVGVAGLVHAPTTIRKATHPTGKSAAHPMSFAHHPAGPARAAKGITAKPRSR